MINSRKVTEEFLINGVRYVRTYTINCLNHTYNIKWYEYKKGKNAITNLNTQQSLEQFYQKYILPDIHNWLHQTHQL